MPGRGRPMNARHRIITAVGVGLCAFAAGWMSGSSSAIFGPAAGARAKSAALSPGPVVEHKEPSVQGAAASRPVLYPDLKLNDEEKELLKMTPEEALAKGDAQGASAQHISRCMELMSDESLALCQRIDQTMHGLRLANLKLLREFLSGTLEVARFQEQYHRNMLAYQVALEGYLSY